MTKEKLTLEFYNKLNDQSLEYYDQIPQVARDFLKVYTHEELTIGCACHLIKSSRTSLKRLSITYGIDRISFFRSIGSRIGYYKAQYKKVKFRVKN